MSKATIGVVMQAVPEGLTVPAPPTAVDGVAFSCVVDDDPTIAAQCYIWLNCMLRLHAIPAPNVFVHAPAGYESALLRWAAALGVNVVPIARFDPRSPHCNKICQLDTFEHGLFKRVVLMDCDTAWVGPMEFPPVSSNSTMFAKVVDRPNPPEEAIAKLFQAARLGEPDWVEVGPPLAGGRRKTDHNNCNGGVYILDRSVLSSLRPLWRKWALWCLDQGEILGRHLRNSDQLGFALALRELGAKVTPLSVDWNYPTHLPAAELPDVAPRILHYHREMTPNLFLKQTGIAQADAAIKEFNRQIVLFPRLPSLDGLGKEEG